MRHLTAFAIAVALVLTVIGLGGVVPQVLFGHDVMFLLEGGQRFLFGSVPSSDYYSPLGPFLYAWMALAMKVVGPTASALVIANQGFFLLITVATLLVVWRRMPGWLTVLVSILIGVSAIAPHHLRFGPGGLSYAGLYNRYAYAMAGVVFLAALLPCARAAGRWSKVEAFVIGALTALTFFTKITYFMVALPMVGLFLVRHRATPGTVVSALAGVVFVCAVFVLLGCNVVYMAGDLRLAAAAKAGGVSWAILGQMLESTARALAPLVVVAAAIGLWYRLQGFSFRSHSFVLIWALLAVPAITGAAFLLILSNAFLGDISEVPLVPVGILALLAVVHVLPTQSESHEGLQGALRAAKSSLILLGLYLALPGFVVDGSSLLNAVRQQRLFRAAEHDENFVHFSSDPLRVLRVYDLGGGWPYRTDFERNYVGKVNDGLQLLRTLRVDRRKIDALDFTNPFPFALGANPSGSTPLFWHLNITVNEKSYPDPQTVFAGTEILMVPKFPEDPATTQVLLTIYQDFVGRNFDRIGDSREWIALKRKTAEATRR